MREPVGDGVRVDSSLLEGSDVATVYDPMLAKVIAWAPDRATALGRLDTALRETTVLGFATNVAFLRALTTHEDVRAGNLDTGLIDRELETLAPGGIPDLAYAAYALAKLAALTSDSNGDDPWTSLVGWRLSGRAPVRFDVLDPDGARLTLTVTGGLDAAEVHVGDRVLAASAEPVDPHGGGLLLTLDGVTRHVHIRDGWIGLDGASWHVLDAPPLRTKADAGAADGEVRSPMPGSVVDRPVEPGASVAAGDPLIVLEAMKMEHVLRAPLAGTVDLLVRPGDQVAVDQVLARVTPGETEQSEGER